MFVLQCKECSSKECWRFSRIRNLEEKQRLTYNYYFSKETGSLVMLIGVVIVIIIIMVIVIRDKLISDKKNVLKGKVTKSLPTMLLIL